MNRNETLNYYAKTLEEIKEAGLFKAEAPYVSPQGAYILMENGEKLLNMCANNYLGLGNSQRLIDAAKKTYDEKGYGLASVRFICGTQDIHKTLEAKISAFLKTEDTILILPASMPTAAYLKHCLAKKMRSFPMSSTTPRSSTACVCARQNATATRTMT